ncbi:hypothetical protein Golob_027778 [Gossypium lobatum]|uniref:CCHC-type domain-containing protein n=1 Tax=Gossypium lobatum TaxID=34289 RepID=A0A7J8NL91_9ROSI|nr:hypothetical protein [Gossypium lobatum]
MFGKSLVVYARFKYEKLSLFCFICGRLGHWESFCPFRLQVEPSKITFGWDLSLRAAGNLSYEGKMLGRNVRGAIGSQNINLNLRQSGLGKYEDNSSYTSGYVGGDVRMVADGVGYGPMDLVSNEKEDPIALLEALETRAADLNKNPKLERSWVEKATNGKKAPK